LRPQEQSKKFASQFAALSKTVTTHRFKVGQMVNYRPPDRLQRAAHGIYEIMRLLPGTSGQPEYRIKHFSEEHERVALESELSAES
jgi:hypothetical protein